ncbi:MAG: short-chain dehydrogenase [Rhodospirillaceae bacterium]|nr:short-chain dehydrogenase [Rhodospirillaceae bacterium]|tara:strand:+ start:8386 stop:9144 length:759 start_codon:yes stop_codon:yes gene_type:complete
MGRLEEKVAFVTAAGGAIAGATARQFGEEGAAVACVDIVEENVKETAADIEAAGGKAIAITCDVTDEAAVKDAIDKTASTFGKLDIVFNAAAFPDPLLPLHELDLDIWRKTFDVNITGMFIVTKHAIPHMLEAGSGSFINISSIYGARSARKRPAYCSSKGAVRMLSKSIAVDYAEHNIRANSILPGPIETPRLLVANKNMDDVIERHRPHLPAARLGQPEEIAQTAVFLASDESSFMSGNDCFVDGAYNAL